MRLTYITKNLLIMNVLVYFGTLVFMGDNRLLLAVFYPTSDYFQPYQIVTYMFMHGTITHLFFNMFGLIIFGPAIEQAWGPRKFLFYYFFTAIGALLLQWFVQFIEMKTGGAITINNPMLGASGAIFGLLAAFGMQYPNVTLRLIFPPIPMKAKYFVIGYAAIELFMGLGNFQSGVAHFAHLGGAIFGVLLILYWRNTGERLY
ncbi:MAG TPA: rhomboid family intramembrane serine protease [Bacteroidetes bacterium]|nr:rhomboid family intramembrane serine protease [Bacteroidota bacterium]